MDPAVVYIRGSPSKSSTAPVPRVGRPSQRAIKEAARATARSVRSRARTVACIKATGTERTISEGALSTSRRCSCTSTSANATIAS